MIEQLAAVIAGKIVDYAYSKWESKKFNNNPKAIQLDKELIIELLSEHLYDVECQLNETNRKLDMIIEGLQELVRYCLDKIDRVETGDNIIDISYTTFQRNKEDLVNDVQVRMIELLNNLSEDNNQHKSLCGIGQDIDGRFILIYRNGAYEKPR